MPALCTGQIAALFMDTPNLQPLLNPRGIVIIGASSDPTKLGYSLARNLVQEHFQGAVHFVNPRGGSLFGRQIYTHVNQAPDPLDLAILLIPAPATPDALRACGQRGIRAAILSSGGFRETGPEGALLEQACLEIAHFYGMRLLGPNCVGLIDTHQRLNATFLQPPGPQPGEIAFLSHSGAICAAIIDWSHGQGFGMSRLVSLGNELDVSATDLFAPLAADPQTSVITLYLESVQSGERFVEEARRTARGKPVVALKVGRYASGQRAAASHTGALAGQDSAFSAAFEKAGILRAQSSEEMFDMARALAWSPPLPGRSIAILTSAGGPGVTAADALEANGLHLADLSEITRQALQSALPPAASVHNPVDMLASAGPAEFAGCLKLVLDDPGVDGVLAIMPPPPASSAGGVARAMIPVIQAHHKPVVFALMGARLIGEAVEHLRAARIPEYRFPERAALAMAALAQRAEFLGRLAEPAVEYTDVNRNLAAQIAVPSSLQGMLPPEQVIELLQAYGVSCAPLSLAVTADQAVDIAQRQGLGQAGCKFVLKIASPDLVHKSDIGGVLLNLDTVEAVRTGFHQLLEKVSQRQPQARLLGAYVQPMAPAGQEVIIGMTRDPQFGPLILFGSGGVEVEGLKDLAFGLAPLSRQEAETMLQRTWAGKKLGGFRSLPAADRAAVIDALLRLAQLSIDCPALAEIEINPLRVLPAGQGVLAIDARCRLEMRKSDQAV